MFCLEDAYKLGFTLEDIEALKIATYFYNKLGSVFNILSRNTKDPRTTKPWKYFKNCRILFKTMPSLSQTAYIDAQIMVAKKSKRMCNPSWLCTANAVKRYLKHIRSKQIVEVKPPTVTFERKCLQALQESALFVQKNLMDLKLNDIYSFLTYKDTQATLPKSFIYIRSGELSYP